MYLQLVRESFTNKSTEGKLFVNGIFYCYTLEDMDRYLEEGEIKIYGKSAIPRGTYKVKITPSIRFKQSLPLLYDVPQFTGIRIHSGNYAGHTTFLKKVKIKDKNDILLSEEYLKVV